MHPHARQGGTTIRVLQASARFEPATSTPDPIHMGDADPTCEPPTPSQNGVVPSENPQVPLSDEVAGPRVVARLV